MREGNHVACLVNVDGIPVPEVALRIARLLGGLRFDGTDADFVLRTTDAAGLASAGTFPAFGDNRIEIAAPDSKAARSPSASSASA